MSLCSLRAPGPLREMASWLGSRPWWLKCGLALLSALLFTSLGAEPVYRAYPSGHDHGVIRRCKVIFATDCCCCCSTPPAQAPGPPFKGGPGDWGWVCRGVQGIWQRSRSLHRERHLLCWMRPGGRHLLCQTRPGGRHLLCWPWDFRCCAVQLFHKMNDFCHELLKESMC